MTNRYDDIINLPYNGSRRSQKMTLRNRAAQFAPFAALTGHDDAIEETARQTTQFIEQSEDELSELTHKLAYILSLPQTPTVKITYFVPDEHKSGGRYVTIKGRIRKVDETLGLLILTDKTEIQLSCISNISETNIL